ncbi:unnamed protein product [Brachionus calyciflorus]|uniref:Sulfotransferase domain-containing protein n=1 Tax=Brachionus calyciflorus TaxID=104777 RepID=A0A814K3V6_9BILA|nr:unnamed protein product [Brachionus calyciflorus]
MSELERIRIEGYNQELIHHRNILFPGFTNDLLKIKTMKLRPDDTFIIGYPKSGTTWTEEIVWLVENNLDYDKSLKTSHFERVLFLDKEPIIKIDQLPAPRVLKSHLPLEYLPDDIAKFCKVIYIMRNPKDVLVSYFSFVKWLKDLEFSGTLEDIVEHFSKNKILYGDWCDHVNKYFSNPDVLFICYEDLLEKQMETVKKIVEFLGKKKTDEEIEKLIEFTSFHKMKTNKSFGMIPKDWNEFIDKFDFKLFFRKGQIGNWVSHFTEKMSDFVDEIVKQKINPKIKVRYLPLKES